MTHLVGIALGLGIPFGIGWAAHALGAPWWAVAGTPLVFQAVVGTLLRQSTANPDAI